MSDEQRLAKIRARVEAATPGPWKSECEGDLVTAGPLSLTLADFTWRRKPNPADALFVAHCREDVPYLLALVADLQRVVADLCEESDAAREAMRYRRALEEIAARPRRLSTVMSFAAEALAGPDAGPVVNLLGRHLPRG